MAKGSQYTIRTHPEGENLFVIKKFDEDTNFVDQYHLSVIPGDAVICNCPAGGRVTCRHRKMLRIFQAMGKIDSGELYNFDHDEWSAAPEAG